MEDSSSYREVYEVPFKPRVWREIKLRRLLKATIRLAYFNLYWLKEEEYDDDMMQGLTLLQDIRMKTAKRKTESLLSKKQKATLSLWPDKRNEADKNYLSFILGHLRCFNRYPEESRQRLAAVGIFHHFPPGRCVLKEGDPPIGWYYILAGKVSIRKNKYTGDGVIEQESNILEKGYVFGEYSLFHGINRSRSAYTLTHCEFLAIHRIDFDAIVKGTVMKHYDFITTYFQKLPYFQNWDKADYLEACLVGKVKEFERNELILGDDVGYSRYTYFVIKGKVRIIHHLMFEVSYSDKLKKNTFKLYEPYNDPDMYDYLSQKLDASGVGTEAVDMSTDHRDFPWQTVPPLVDYFQLEMVKKLPDHVHTCFIKIYTIGEFGCFNLGENFRHRFAIAETDSKCVCLLIPRHWLWRRNVAYIWSRLVKQFNSTIPNAEIILDKYVKKRLWDMRRRKIAKKILKKSKFVNLNTINNVPYSLRLKEDLSVYDDAFSTTSKERRGKYR